MPPCLEKLVAAAVITIGTAGADLSHGPNEPDAHTLHLWHLDEYEPPFQDTGSHPTPLFGLLNGTRAGAASLPGLKSAIAFEWRGGPEKNRGELPYGPILLSQAELDLGPADNTPSPFPVMGADGAFTMEAVVKLNVLPNDSPSYAADIITMDEEDPANRIFLFRIEKPGFLSFVPLSGDAVRGGGLATIPTTGPHAIDTRHWFHVAVTYDGRQNISHNLKFYWTRLDGTATAANFIGRGTLSADLSRNVGDFAIGNSGKFNPLGPFEFFPGLIDEVRISSIARDPSDYFFVPPALRHQAPKETETLAGNEPPSLVIRQVLVDDAPGRWRNDTLIVPPGNHRLDFDFGFPAGIAADPLSVKCQLEGLDEDWRPTASGMTLTWEMLDATGRVIASTRHSAKGTSSGWATDLLDTRLTRRIEPLYIPEATRNLRVTLSSGTPDTTGCWVIDDFSLTRTSDPEKNLWFNGGFEEGERTDQIGGIPSGWSRLGSEPSIARLMLAENVSARPALGLLDAEQEHAAGWTSTRGLPFRPAPGGETLLVAWSEAFNIISGSSLRSTYSNVPPGEYRFRAIALSGHPTVHSSRLEIAIVVQQPFWQETWFLPAAVALGTLSLGAVFFGSYRRRSRHRLAVARLANAVERDRARIARDMHDDLGTRVSMIKHAAHVVGEALDGEPVQARNLVRRLETAASDLVRAMDELVWAVNPKNDTLEQLATHLSNLAQDLFRHSPVRLRIDIPPDLPPIPLSSDFRHHFSLSVKEALHNVFKHAGPCTATLRIALSGGCLHATIEDDGCGFDPEHPPAGNGLSHLHARLRELQGTCTIQSQPGHPTTIHLTCPVAAPTPLE